MDALELFLACALASRNADVESALDEFAVERSYSSYRDLPSYYLGGRDNNRGPIEAMSDARNAVYEKVMNGFDAVIDLYQRHNRFSTNPNNAAEALAEIGSDLSNPGVYLITSKANTYTGERGSPKRRANILICDEGTGILGAAFKGTILSIEGSNKSANPLMAGSYGMGGSAIYADSDFSLIYSIAESDPSAISFTVVYKVYRAGMRFPSYVALESDDGDMLQIDISDLPSGVVSRPADIDARNVIDYASNRIIVPEHGTGVKVFELEGFTSSQSIYGYLRDRGFGMEIPCRFRNGVPVQDALDDDVQVGDGLDKDDSSDPVTQGQTRRLYNVLGARSSLNNPSRRTSYPVVYSVQQPILFENGKPQAYLKLWVIKRASEKRTKLASQDREISPKSSKQPSPVESVLGKERRTTPIYVTLNGMTQDNLPSHVLLRSADLNYISGNVVIEVDCNIMAPTIRGSFLTSTRERIKADWGRRLKEDIEKFLKHERQGKLGEVNEELREAFLRASTSEDTSSGVALFQKVMKSSVVGTLFNKFGPQVENTSKLSKLGTGSRRDASTRLGGKLNRLGPRPEPIEIEVRKHIIKRGEVQYITVRTDAFDDWDDAVSLEVSSCLTIKHRRPLLDGRVTYTVECDPEVDEGFKGRLVARLDRSRIKKGGLCEECEFTVVRPSLRETGIKPQSQAMIPDIQLVPVKPFEESWERIMDPGGMSGRVAYHFDTERSGKVIVFYNSEFTAFVDGMNSLSRKKVTQHYSLSYETDYKLALQLLVLSELETFDDTCLSSDERMKQLHLSRAAAARSSAALILWNIERLSSVGTIGVHEEEAA